MKHTTDKEKHHVTRLVRALSAFTPGRSTSGFAGRDTHSLAGREQTLDFAGSGAPSYRGRVVLFSLSALALTSLVLLVASAQAAKEVIQFVGSANSGSVGAQFSGPRDTAVNSTGAGGVPVGTFYVADGGNNNRIQRFNEDGSFVAAWGANVLKESSNEVQTLTVEATAGSYTLEFEGQKTGDIAYNASATAVQTALRALSTVGSTSPQSLVVSGTAPYEIKFQGKFTASNVGQIVADDTELSGSATTAHPIQGFGQYEICTVAANCLAGAATGAPNYNNNKKNGSLSSPESVAVDDDTGHVYVSDRNNFRVNEYTATGVFVRSFGFGVDATVAGAGYEICPAANSCTAGLSGSGTGQIGSTTTTNTLGIAISPADGEASVGKVFLADTQNRRVNTYELDGTSPASFGTTTQFNATQPRKIAVDSRGIVYASNSKNQGEVVRYDSENANGGGIGFLGAIEASVPGVNEKQRITFSNGFEGIYKEGDTFTLTCPGGETTNEITFAEINVTLQARIREALEAKCGGSFNMGGGFYMPEVTFTGSFEETDVPTMTCTTVTGEGVCNVTTPTQGKAEIVKALLSSSSEATATGGLAVRPDSDGGGPDTDVLFVLRDPNKGPTAVQQFGTEHQPGLTAGPTEDDDRHGTEADFSSVNGLGFDDSSGRLFVSSTANVSGLGFGSRVYILDEVGPPDPALDPITTFDSNSATFTGTVDPESSETAFRFEYVDHAEFLANGFDNAAQVPPTQQSVGHGTTPVAVEADTPTDLAGGTMYHVRLVAKRVFSTVEVVDEKTFTTTGSAPGIEGTIATQVKTDSANLRAAINPENDAVSYYFNWGPTSGYGNSTAVDALAAGIDTEAGFGELTGLSPGTTYHYQVVATNGVGTTMGPDQTFTTPAQEPGLPAERGYEIVSQYPTGGVPIIPTGSQPHISSDGNHVEFSSYNPLPNTPTGLADQFGQGAWMYDSSRGDGMWNVTGTQLIVEFFQAGISADARHILKTTSVGLDPDDQNNAVDAYVRQPDGTFVWVSRDPRIPVGTPQTATGPVQYGGGDLSSVPVGSTLTPEGDTVVFTTERPLNDLDTTTGCNRVYKWKEGEGVSFLGVRPDGTVPQYNDFNCSFVPSSGQDALSADGRRVVWAARRTDDSGNTLYVSTDGEPTVEAVKETGVPPLEVPPTGSKPPYNVTYRGAALEDGSRVFFTSASRLTPDSAAANANGGDADLYAYSVADDKVRDLTPRLDGLSDPEVTSAYRGRARGMLWNSEDGGKFYFVSDARYPVAPSPTGELPSADGRNLYMGELDGIDDPIRLRFIAALGAGDDSNWQPNVSEKTAFGSPDGSYLAFASEEDLTEQPLGDSTQMFVYDAVNGTLECASCPTDGTLPANDVNELLQENGEEIGYRWQFGNGGNHWVSTDGTVFFDTASALLPADQNAVEDVYEFRNGQLRLISAGTGSNPSRFENASIDGANVLIHTFDALAVQDKEPGQPKLYNARVGGGFAKAIELPSCDINAGACEGAGTTAPERVGAGTGQFEGPGNNDESPQVRCKLLALGGKELAVAAKRLRRAARSAARAGQKKRAKQLRRRAGRLGRKAGKQSAKAKSCHRGSAGTSRAANTNRRAHR
jgi:hypothetical protein